MSQSSNIALRNKMLRVQPMHWKVRICMRDRAGVGQKKKSRGISPTLHEPSNLRPAVWLLCAYSVSFLLKQVHSRESTQMEGGGHVQPVLPSLGQELTQQKSSLATPSVIFLCLVL